MNTSHPDEEGIFHTARGIGDPEARAAYLADACAGDAALRRRVGRLLRVHEQDGSFLAEPVCAARLERSAAGEGPGDLIGPYRLVEPIGEGGMGVVYSAEQSDPIRRLVALKVVKPGMDTRQVIARFEIERQALAMMDHPNIARVFDAGATAQGRPYFVMELVPGPPITEYCDRERLTIPERLELFVLVCRAVQHAHQKGVIHRDLKPSNILVKLHDGVATPKVIDFGIAKAVEASLTGRTVYTTTAAQFVGTPMYMSPEQAGLSGVDVDTRSDVYSLGVVLYELLTGTTPFDATTFREAAFDELRRLIREDDPPKPSTRLGSLGETLTSVSADRRTEARRLDRTIRGDLDWMVMKALEKDRRRRYQTANDFARDVMKFLNDEPVDARPPSAWYQFTKYARRNRPTLITAALVGLALVAGTVGSAWQAVRATRAERSAQEHQRRSERHFYAFNLRQVQEIIEQGEVERAQERLASLRDELGERKTSDFGWRYLHLLAARAVETFVKHPADIGPIRISPDGRLLASGDLRGMIRLTDLTSGRVLNTIDGKSGFVRDLSFSPDSRYLLADVETVESPNRVETVIWEISTGNRVGSVGPYDVTWMWPSAFSSSGRRLALVSRATEEGPVTATLFDFASRPARPVLLNELRFQFIGRIALDHATVGSQPYDSSFTVFDTETFQRRWTLSAEARDHGSPVLSEDGRRIGLENDQYIVIRDTATGEEQSRVVRGEGSRLIEIYALSRDGGMLLARSEPPLSLSLINLKDEPPQPRREIPLENPERYQRALAFFSPDASKVAVTPLDGRNEPGPVTVWESATGRHLATYPGQARVLSEVFSPDGESLFLKCDDVVWRWWFGRARYVAPERLDGHRDEAWALAFSPQGRVLASGSDDTENDDTIKLWDPATGRLLKSWRADPGTVSALAFSPDGRVLASASLDPSKNLRLWDVENGLLRRALIGHTDKVRSVAFSPDGRILASAGADRTIRLWEAATGRPLASLSGHANVIRKVVFSPDGRTLASACNDRTVRLWNVASARETRTSHGLEKYAAVAFAPDGSTLAAADEGGDIAVWDVATGDRQRVIHCESTRLMTLAYSPDGQTLAAAGMGRSIRVWDVLTGQELLTLRGHAAQINDLAFEPNGNVLASCSHNGEVRLWRANQRLAGAVEPSSSRP
ncbi:protein kinase domain-containing protein [Paludisphaera rhizosphaerae]|uniref:protein kinase domain-containing protein n=1 Tax=Paludisphaera rhizosphaerae TaxID=2711216 RepID=UPI0013EE1616|nr:protein kinase [Paludisphaera rhizosphaerae]